MEEQYLEAVVKPLVSFPDDVKVDRTQDERGVLLTLHLNAQDMGKIIGRAGETAKAIRYLVRCFGAMNKSHVSMKIYEPDRQTQGYGERRPQPARRHDEFGGNDDFGL